MNKQTWPIYFGDINSCKCNITQPPINVIESGRIEYIKIAGTYYIGVMDIDGIRYYDAETICKTFGWKYDLTVVPEFGMFKFELPNKIMGMDENNNPIEINIGESLTYVNAYGIQALCMNTLNNMTIQSFKDDVEVVPLPFEPEPEPDKDSTEEGEL